MIPEKIADFLHGPVFLSIGTCDDKLRPSHAWVTGAVVSPDRETITCFVVQARAAKVLPNLESNGRITLSAGNPKHEAYQLKGRYVSSRPADDKDRAVQEIYRSKLVPFMLQCGRPEQTARPFAMGFAYHPALAITFRAEEIFLQIPGPEAGKRIQ